MTIQSRKKMYNKTTMNQEELSRKFSRLMMEGKLNAAIRLLEGSSATVLPLTDDDTIFKQTILRHKQNLITYYYYIRSHKFG